MPDAPDDERINEQIERGEQNGEKQVQLGGNKTRINDHGNIVLDKPALITGLAAARAEIVFPRRQRAEPDEILDEKAPDERGQMKLPDPAPAQDGQSAENREKDKAEMSDQNKIGQKTKNHRVK